MHNMCKSAHAMRNEPQLSTTTGSLVTHDICLQRGARKFQAERLAERCAEQFAASIAPGATTTRPIGRSANATGAARTQAAQRGRSANRQLRIRDRIESLSAR
jgi:hypothetical protein